MQQVKNKLGLEIDNNMRPGSLETDVGFVNIHSSKFAHWVAYLHENSSVTRRCPPPNELFCFMRSKHGHFFIFKVQKLLG